MDIKKKEDRKDRTGIVGSPKKGGAGGKGTWGKGGKDDLIEANVDSKDPNYESDDDKMIPTAKSHSKDILISKVEVDSPIEIIVRGYFAEGDISEVIRKLKEVKVDLSEFIRKSMYLSMERQPYERELISKLLTALYNNAIPAQEYDDGFKSALRKLDDTIIDIPEAGDMLGKFIARAIMDEIIPPAFLKSVELDTNCVRNCVASANGHVNDPHRSRKLEHIWGPGDLDSVKRLKKEVQNLIDEYLLNNEKEEAEKSLRRLNVPSFHFQVVRQALQSCLLKNTNGEEKKILVLLSFFKKTGIVTEDAMIQGFKNCESQLSDIKLDAPKADSVFAEIIKSAQQDGTLPSNYK